MSSFVKINKNKNKKNKSKKVVAVVSRGKIQNVRNVGRPPKARPATAGILGGLGSMAGGFLGNMVMPGAGAAIGGMLGRAGGDILGKITGMGDYSVTSNSLIAGPTPPEFRSGAHGSVTIGHREFITDIQSSIDFVNREYIINPGMAATFPFLAAIANNFEQYEVIGMLFEFKSSSGNALSSTNTSLGMVVMATNYDVLDAPFTSKQQMEAYEFCTSVVPSMSALHPIECAASTRPVNISYVRNSTFALSNADPRWYDLGRFQLATVGCQSTVAVLGELWVTYHIKLIKPKLPTPLGGNQLYGHLLSKAAGTATDALIMGTSAATIPGLARGSTLGISLAAPNSFLLPFAGRFIVVVQMKGSAMTSGGALVGGSNISGVALFANNTAIFQRADAAGGLSISVYAYDVLANSYGTNYAPNTITFSGAVNYTAGNTDVWAFQIAGDGL